MLWPTRFESSKKWKQSVVTAQPRFEFKKWKLSIAIAQQNLRPHKSELDWGVRILKKQKKYEQLNLQRIWIASQG